MRFILAAVLVMLIAAPAAAQSRNPFETREDAWRRQQSEQYQFQQRNQNSLNPPAGRLGDSPVRPSYQEQQRWAPSSPSPSYGSGGYNSNSGQRRY